MFNGEMGSYENPLHSISAQLCEIGITDYSVQQKYRRQKQRNPGGTGTVERMDISGSMTADALNCQKKTAKAVVDGKGDYSLRVKGNHAGLEADTADYVQDAFLRKSMDTGV